MKQLSFKEHLLESIVIAAKIINTSENYFLYKSKRTLAETVGINFFRTLEIEDL